MVKVTVLTGFLGAGKTTLLQRILTQSSTKCAVIQNELSEGKVYAEMGIESPVITDAAGTPFQEFYELANGCICCSVRGSFLTTVERIVTQRRDIELIVVETTGLADPVPIVTLFWQDSALESSVALDGVVTLVDLQAYGRRMQDPQYGELYRRQLVVADRVLLNKADLVSAESVESVRAAVAAINPTAAIFTTERANIDISAVTDIQGLVKTDLPREKLRLHLHDISVLVFSAEELGAADAISVDAWEAFLAEILWEREGKPYGNIIRGKGLLHLADSLGIGTLQIVDETFEITPTRQPWASAPDTRLMLTGTKLHADAILGAFRRICGSG